MQKNQLILDDDVRGKNVDYASYDVKKHISKLYLDDFSFSFFVEKSKSQDARIEELEEKCESICLQLAYTKMQNTLDNSYIKKDFKSREVRMILSEPVKLTNDIIADVKHLDDVDELRDQIGACVRIKEQTLKLLNITKTRQEENYQKSCIHLFFQAISRNYARQIFKHSQLNLLVEILEESKKPFVDEERYFELDERLYNEKLDIFTEVE